MKKNTKVTRRLVAFFATMLIVFSSLRFAHAEELAVPAGEISVSEISPLSANSASISEAERNRELPPMGAVAGETTNQRLEIVNGLTTLTWLPTGATKQLTPSPIAKDGGIAGDGTVYILYNVTNSLWGYNYNIQGANGDLIPIVTSQYPNSAGDTSVISLTFQNGLVTGYSSAGAGNSPLFSIDELKARAIETGQLSNDSGSGSGSESGSDPSSDKENSLKKGKLFIRNGEIIYSETINGVDTETTLAIIGKIANYCLGGEGTYTIRTDEDCLYLINPEISLTPYLYSRECTGITINGGKVTSYTIDGTEVPALTLEGVKALYNRHVKVVAAGSKWDFKVIINDDQVLRVRYRGKTLQFFEKKNSSDEAFTKRIWKKGGTRGWGVSPSGEIYVLRGNKLSLLRLDAPKKEQLKLLEKTKGKKNKFLSFVYTNDGTVISVNRKSGEDPFPLP